MDCCVSRSLPESQNVSPEMFASHVMQSFHIRFMAQQGQNIIVSSIVVTGRYVLLDDDDDDYDDDDDCFYIALFSALEQTHCACIYI